MKKQIQPTPLTSTELLAPAGTPDAAWAAFGYGADAIYAGLPRFSARAEAGHFSLEALDEVIGFAHQQHKKVYITLNTLIQQAELPDALEALAHIEHLNADGVIVQDMGIARIIKNHFPTLELHASTQLAAHNLDGAKLLADIGFSRVVLARELSLPEISTITAECGIETEVFIHGALCYSYSGLCLFSSHLYSRSGNRGRCAYCCRQTFNQNQLPFAMKDLSLAEYIPELLHAGVHALKIEGRMKSPLYVGAVSDLYRKLLQRQLKPAQLEQLLSDIQTIFGRPSTDLYFNSPRTHPVDPTTNGHRGAFIGSIAAIRKNKGGSWLHFKTNRSLRKYDGLKVELPEAKEPYGFPAHELILKSDPKQRLLFEIPAHKEIAIRLPDDHPFLPPGAPIYCSISQEVRERYPFETPRPGTTRQHTPVNITVSLSKQALTIQAGETELTLPGTFAPARQPERTPDAIRKSFSKTKDTEWELGELTIKDPEERFAPASLLNDARRQFMDLLSAQRAEANQLKHFARLETLAHDAAQAPHLPADAPCSSEDLPPIRWSIKVPTLELLSTFTEEEMALLEEIILDAPHSTVPSTPSSTPPIRYAQPIIQRSNDPKHPASSLAAATPLELSNIGALHAARSNGHLNLTADWPLYTLNTQAAQQWNELGLQQSVLSPEDTRDNMLALVEQLKEKAVVPLFQYTPLMISATRPDSDAALEDRQQNEYRLEEHNGTWVLYSQSPFNLTDHMDELRKAGATRFRIDFSYGVDSPQLAALLFKKITNRQSIPNSHDGNWNQSL